MKRLLFALAFGLFVAPVLHADPAPVMDPAQVAAHYREVLAQPQYQDTHEPDAEDRFKSWLSQWFGRLGAEFGHFKYAQEMPRFASMMMTVLVIISIVGLLYTAVRLFRRHAWSEFQSPGGETPVFRPPEFYEAELRRAVDASDWSGAWLAGWRQFLSRLEQGHLVEADRSRTNREYLAQLRARPLPESAVPLVAGMVDAYDTFIYGCRTVAQEDWQTFRAQLNEATLLLHLENRPPTAHP